MHFLIPFCLSFCILFHQVVCDIQRSFGVLFVSTHDTLLWTRQCNCSVGFLQRCPLLDTYYKQLITECRVRFLPTIIFKIRKYGCKSYRYQRDFRKYLCCLSSRWRGSIGSVDPLDWFSSRRRFLVALSLDIWLHESTVMRE